MAASPQAHASWACRGPRSVGVVGRDDPASIVYADREFIEPKVRAFVDRAAELLA